MLHNVRFSSMSAQTEKGLDQEQDRCVSNVMFMGSVQQVKG